MTNLTPSDKALVPFVSVDNMMKLIHHIGIEPMLIGLGEYIEADFKRWELFDKTPRVASHSEQGVIELMPTSDVGWGPPWLTTGSGFSAVCWPPAGRPVLTGDVSEDHQSNIHNRWHWLQSPS